MTGGRGSRTWRAVAAAGLCGLILSHRSAAAAGAEEIVAVHIVSRVGDRAVPDDRPKRARIDAGVTLFAVLVAEVAGERVVFAGESIVELGGRRHRARPLREAPSVALHWFKIEPKVATLSNTASGAFRFERIPYAEVAMNAWRGRAQVAADVHPTLTPDHGQGVGTMRYRLTVVTAAGARSTPGLESLHGRGSGGLSDRVHRVSLRRDDTAVGVLTEMFGQPYIWASAGTRDDQHQSERLEGSDCADFVVYGRRRQGGAVAYTWTGGLPGQTRLLDRGTAGADGIYRDGAGRPLRFPAAGDLALFPRHVGVLSQDRGQIGTLDRADLILHSYFDTPREQALGETAYAATWLEVRRWRR
jgi:hypothetical protein